MYILSAPRIATEFWLPEIISEFCSALRSILPKRSIGPPLAIYIQLCPTGRLSKLQSHSLKVASKLIGNSKTSYLCHIHGRFMRQWYSPVIAWLGDEFAHQLSLHILTPRHYLLLALSSMPINYRSYTTPNPAALYSVEFFKKITFASARTFQLPDIALPGSVMKWVFDNTTPGCLSHIEFSPTETIPHIDDLLPVCGALESAFRDGHCSVIFALRVHGIEECYCYHMSKVRRCDLDISRLSILTCPDLSRCPAQQQCSCHPLGTGTCYPHFGKPSPLACSPSRVQKLLYYGSNFRFSCHYISAVEAGVFVRGELVRGRCSECTGRTSVLLQLSHVQRSLISLPPDSILQ